MPRAAGLTGAPGLAAQTDDSVPLPQVTLFGASPSEAAGEVWGIAPKGSASVIVRYSQAGGWTYGPALENSAGEALKGFHLDTPEAFRHSTPSPLAGQVASDGAAALLGTVGSGAASKQVVLVRDPGGAFKEAPVPEGGEGLVKEESLFGANSPPLVAALEEQGGKAGALVVPTGVAHLNDAVLHWNGESWSRETIEVPASSSSQLEVLAIGASSPDNAWLLARLEGETRRLALFRRNTGSATPDWQPVALKPGGEAAEALELAGETLDEPGNVQSQLLTTTSSGLWIDGMLRTSRASATMYFSPQGESDSGTVTGSWCKATAAKAVALCEGEGHALPQALPTDYSRSFAWPGSGGEGERIVTGLTDGQMLRFGGSTFSLVNSLGGEAGNKYGAAFASSSDGWLGKEKLPVHISATTVASRLQPWPVPFRFALTALAPEPGAPVGAETSEALAVGDNGEVARYHPGAGWFPETLPGPGGARQTPRLRAVAWPTPSRAFAVGDEKQGAGQMWLWRGETGLWEKDPAMPLNFRGNLLGIAFDPADSSRGYAVGQQGVLLSYGKSWTQEPEEAIPAAARGASFTSIAFAGSEAIVAWRKLIHIGSDAYTGGVIANSGSGWHEDEGAAAVLGTNAVPWAVAALPDGGAAFTARAASEALIYERNAPGAPWQAVSYPGGEAPGDLVLFREGGALRAIGTGAEPPTYTAEEESPPPPGFPPVLVDPYPLISEPDRGVLRQTATGWNDEEHELNDALEPPGGYVYWDTPKIPDPVSALLVNESGTQGWAAGGVVETKRPLLDTSDIERYPAEGKSPPGLAASAETTRSERTSIAIGGGAGCAAPCARRADSGIGPDVWFKHAVQEAGEIREGNAGRLGNPSISAFLYTGPGVTNGALAGPPLVAVPWQEEERYYSARTSGTSPLVCIAPSPNDREGTGEGSEALFEESFQLGTGGSPCEAHHEGASYSFEPSTPAGQPTNVRVIVLDTSHVQAGQRVVAPAEISWLEAQLAEASGHAVVVGNADLPLEYSEGRASARELVAVIEAGKAAAYFYDAPEQNVQGTLTGSSTATPAFGSGTLGYVNVANEEVGGFIGQSGFLVAEISNTEKKNGRYVVEAKLIPNIEELAVEAQQGTLLRRSQVASFAGLARRPRSGNRAHNQSVGRAPETAPYIAIPDNCVGAACAQGIVPEYTFHSSDTHYGEFVKRDLQSPEPNAVERDAHGNRVSQEAEGGKDGLFCALNATPAKEPIYVTLKVANLSYSLPVTIEAGSVRQPCGTTALALKPATQEVETPTQQVTEGGGSPSTSPPITLTLPAAPAVAAPPLVHPPAPLPQFLPQTGSPAFIPSFLPPPLPTPARPTPPSGTSAVTSPVEAAQKEEEEEAAPESVDAAASAYHSDEHEAPPYYLLGVVMLAAFAGASLRGRRGPRRKIRVAPATVSSSQMQRRWEREEELRRRRRR